MHVPFAVWFVAGGISLWCRLVLGSYSASNFGVEGKGCHFSVLRYPNCFQHHSTSTSLKVKFRSMNWKKRVNGQLPVPFMFLQSFLTLQLELFLLLCFQITFPICHLPGTVCSKLSLCSCIEDLSVYWRNGIESEKVYPLPDNCSGIVCMTVQGPVENKPFDPIALVGSLIFFVCIWPGHYLNCLIV